MRQVNTYWGVFVILIMTGTLYFSMIELIHNGLRLIARLIVTNLSAILCGSCKERRNTGSSNLSAHPSAIVLIDIFTF